MIYSKSINISGLADKMINWAESGNEVPVPPRDREMGCRDASEVESSHYGQRNPKSRISSMTWQRSGSDIKIRLERKNVFKQVHEWESPCNIFKIPAKNKSILRTQLKRVRPFGSKSAIDENTFSCWCSKEQKLAQLFLLQQNFQRLGVAELSNSLGL